jgi:hypothetical protein
MILCQHDLGHIVGTYDHELRYIAYDLVPMRPWTQVDTYGHESCNIQNHNQTLSPRNLVMEHFLIFTFAGLNLP